jgi:hypothetical protein
VAVSAGVGEAVGLGVRLAVGVGVLVEVMVGLGVLVVVAVWVAVAVGGSGVLVGGSAAAPQAASSQVKRAKAINRVRRDPPLIISSAILPRP